MYLIKYASNVSMSQLKQRKNSQLSTYCKSIIDDIINFHIPRNVTVKSIILVLKPN